MFGTFAYCHVHTSGTVCAICHKPLGAVTSAKFFASMSAAVAFLKRKKLVKLAFFAEKLQTFIGSVVLYLSHFFGSAGCKGLTVIGISLTVLYGLYLAYKFNKYQNKKEN